MAAQESKTDSLTAVFNVPNQLTTARLVLATVLFVFLALAWYKTSLVLFLIAVSTDWLDGYWARKYGQVTVLGRILDPFADKMIICGTFVFLAAVIDSGVHAWMAVVILGRELLVTALRSFLEDRGEDFSARMVGKWKMVLQCVAAAASMVWLALGDTSGASAAAGMDLGAWMPWLVSGLVWAAVALTVYSGVAYVLAAVRLVRRSV